MSSKNSHLCVQGFKIGHAHLLSKRTGCSVVLCEKGFIGGVDQRGSAPGTRETDLLNPLNTAQEVHGICLAGGSAFGLAAADGVMHYLKEKKQGVLVNHLRIPIVPSAVLFDCFVGDSQAYPDPKMGYQAAKTASKTCQIGRIGAGCGATVAKALGISQASMGGIGYAKKTFPNGLELAALIALNAFGDIIDPQTNQILAAPKDLQNNQFIQTKDLYLKQSASTQIPTQNTTIGVMMTNAKLNKTDATKLAQVSHNGLARCIHPVHTNYDGDTLFSLASGQIEAQIDTLLCWAADVVCDAVVSIFKQKK